jgi:DNA-binding winged helix-turn-helix (wHTH) protein
MVQEHFITFGPFRLDTTQVRLWRGDQAIPLRRRSFMMLRYLATHPGRLVTKAELRQHVWAGTHVTDTVLRVCLREIRAALGDAAEAPQYLQTVGGQGYTFCVQGDGTVSPPAVAGPLIVGRQREIDTLDGWFQRAASGDRQLVFLSGEAGAGKTTVLDLWLAPWPQGTRCGADGDSAPSTMGKWNRTCHFWRPWGGSATDHRGRRSGQCCGGMRPCGSCNSPGC